MIASTHEAEIWMHHDTMPRGTLFFVVARRARGRTDLSTACRKGLLTSKRGATPRKALACAYPPGETSCELQEAYHQD